MNKKILFAIIIAVIAVGGYFLFPSTKGEPIISGEEDDFVTHTSKEFSFKYPKNWFVEDRSDQEFFPYVSLVNYKSDQFVNSPHATGNFLKIEIVKLPNENKLTLKGWVDNFVENSESEPVVLNTETITLSNRNAISNIERANGLADHPAIYIDYNESVYIINISPLTGEYESIYQKFLESFKFN